MMLPKGVDPEMVGTGRRQSEAVGGRGGAWVGTVA